MEEEEGPNGRRDPRLHAVPGQAKPGLKRKERPGQPPPLALPDRRDPANAAEHPKNAGEDREADRDHAQDARKKQDAFDDRREENVRTFWEHTPTMAALRRQRTAALAGLSQGAVDVAAQRLLEAPCGCCGQAVKAVDTWMVEIVDFEYRAAVKVPMFECTDTVCSAPRFSVPPAAAYCAPTSPTIYCRKWFTISVLELFARLTSKGVAGAGEFSPFHVRSYSMSTFDVWVSVLQHLLRT
jgi:hypothetical protein